jgi:hypothetical protein
MKNLISFLILSVVVVGCSPRKRTVAEASLITTNMTLQQVVNKMGKCQIVLHGRNGFTQYAYHLADGSMVLFDPERPFMLTNRIQAVTFIDRSNVVMSP